MVDCEYCGVNMKKGDKFVVVGAYTTSFEAWLQGSSWCYPEDFGKIYHEACYLQLVKIKKALNHERNRVLVPLRLV
jgi:hypothetical protein